MCKCWLQITLLRAVKNAPDSARKGNLGHGICDYVNRSITLPDFVSDEREISRVVRELVTQLQIPAKEVRGMGVQVLFFCRYSFQITKPCRTKACHTAANTRRAKDVVSFVLDIVRIYSHSRPRFENMDIVHGYSPFWLRHGAQVLVSMF